MKRREFFAFAAPSLLMMFGLMIVPVFFTIYLGFTRYSFGTTPEWVGLRNYTLTLRQGAFWNAVRFTLLFMAFAIPLQILTGFVMALLLDNVQRIQGVIVTAALIPAVVTPVVSALVFGSLFEDRSGFYSWLLSLVGINIRWFATAASARALLIMHSVWQSTPFVFITLYAGLQAMSREQLESAQLDGANYAQRIRHIIVPSLAPLFIFIAIINLMDAYRVFDSVFVMTRGGPGAATESVMFYNYNVAFAQDSLGRGSAISVLTIIGIFVLLIPFLYQTYRQQTATK